MLDGANTVNASFTVDVVMPPVYQPANQIGSIEYQEVVSVQVGQVKAIEVEELGNSSNIQGVRLGEAGAFTTF